MKWQFINGPMDGEEVDDTETGRGSAPIDCHVTIGSLVYCYHRAVVFHNRDKSYAKYIYLGTMDEVDGRPGLRF